MTLTEMHGNWENTVLEKETPKSGDDASGDAASRAAQSGADSNANAYWRMQDAALGKVRQNIAARSKTRRAGKQAESWKRVCFTLPRQEAKEKAREFLAKYPKSAYWSEVESWRELPGDIIEFTMRRLPSAD
jgi:hypothetical protein